VGLKKADREKLSDVLGSGLQPVRTVLRALTLGHLHEGKSVSEVASIVRLTSKAVREIGRRYDDAGLEQALYDKPRPGASPIPEEGQRHRIIAMVCSDPPEGHARWTIRLVVDEAVKRRLARVGRETIRLLLLHDDLKPWREENGVRTRTR
jgi:transposase